MPEQYDKPFLPFRDFVDSLSRASHADLLRIPFSRIRDEDAFAELRQHLIDIYAGAEVLHSFMADNGHVFDCIPAERQPALKRTGQKPAPPPASPPPELGESASYAAAALVEFDANRKDRFGNPMQCPPGTVPIRRVTLEEISRFGTLLRYRQKAPLGRERHPRLSPPALGAAGHRYAIGSQAVASIGGHCAIGIWDPPVQGDAFSLAQVWCATRAPVQTVECGWQVWPSRYGDARPILFVYWTADGYQTTGSYNSSDFVQQSQTIAPGAPLTTVSSPGGQQFEIDIAWQLVSGNWWLYVNRQSVGYFPGSLFQGGPLAAGATELDFGGETYTTGAWPPMGSGAFANGGAGNTAYARDVYFFPAAGGAQPAALAGSQTSAACYTSLTGAAAPPWNTFVFFGGPGGADCGAGLTT
jgi:hypothetical protein